MIQDSPARSFIAYRLLVAAAFVVVVGGIRLASPILVPFLFAVFLAIVLDPLLYWLQRKGCPTAIAICLVVGGVTFAGAVLVGIVGTSIANFAQNAVDYQVRLNAFAVEVRQWLATYGIKIPEDFDDELLQSGEVLPLVASSLMSLNVVVRNAILILLTLIFLMTEGAVFARKLRAIELEEGALTQRVETIVGNVRKYISIKTVISLATGVTIGVSLATLGLDYPVLWGLIAFLFNYIPNIGSLIAGVPPTLLALVQFGLPGAIGVALIFLAVNQIFGMLIEPHLQGRGLGLSPLVVFVSLVFWGWVLGPIGMLLSAPLTMVVKIVLDSDEDTRWIATLLGSSVPGEKQ